MNDSPDRFLHGVLPVLQTPFTDRGEIDRAVLEREIDWAFDIGADGVVVAMVSEILRLGYSGRIQLAELVCQAVRGRGACVISVGAESTVEAIGFATHAEKHGASALMAIPRWRLRWAVPRHRNTLRRSLGVFPFRSSFRMPQATSVRQSI
jgi:dihydrodipicolinate synthase/N-acetylneuraminate lyase